MIIRKENFLSFLLFSIGIFCQIQPLISRGITSVYVLLCFFPFLISINTKKVKISLGFVWYLLFTLFCMLSLVYTINKIDPDYVYRRILVYLILLFMASPFLDEEKNIKTLVKGFIFGGIIGISVVLINQYNLIGIRRLGANLYGSYAEFGNVCMLSFACLIWMRKSISQKKIIKILLFLLIIVGTLLSGARKAILVPLLMIIFLQLFDKRKQMTKKIVILTILSAFSLFFIYASLNNEYLYKSVGYRIESGLSSIIGHDSDDASLYERNKFKILAKQMFRDKPLQGWGMHSFAYRNFLINGRYVYSHDGFLEILSCYGVIGFILFYWSFVYIIVNYKKLLFDNTGIFLFSYIVIILLMEPYSISFLNSYYLLIICSSINLIRKREKNESNS